VDLRRSREQVELPDELPGGDPIEAETFALLEIVRQLPDAYRETLLMRLVEGMSGNDVSALQMRLQRFGLLAAVDDNFGPSTADAVRTFQSSNGLPPTGIADRPTLAALGFDTSAVPA